MSQTDILLYIALSEEFDDVSDGFKELGYKLSPQELEDIAITVFHTEIPSSHLNKSFKVTILPAGKMGISRAASTTSTILLKFKPGNIVVLGIAGSFSEDLQPGDVFIPSSVEEYLANSAIKGDQRDWYFEVSGNELPTSQRLLNRYQLFKQTNEVIFNEWSVESTKRISSLLDISTKKKIKKSKYLLKE